MKTPNLSAGGTSGTATGRISTRHCLLRTAIVLSAGALQFTAWKARQLACCREAPGRGQTLVANARVAWRHGLHLGAHCVTCCAGLTTILLVIGVMDLRAMAAVASAITVERLAPAGERVARGIGAAVIGAGVLMIALSARPG